jgi:phenylacetate-CoA ligase
VIGPGVACETLDSDGWLHVQDDHFLVEALDPASGRPVADGELGELTFTTVTKEALPLLRYRTGDLARLDRAPTPERTTVKMSKVVGRVDDMLIIRGVNIYPSEIETVVLGDEGVGPQYVLVIDARGALPRLVVCCESRASTMDRSEVEHRLVGALARRLSVSCDVRVSAPGTLPRTEVGKAQRVIRWTEGASPIPGLA